MPKFSQISLGRLSTCDQRLQAICRAAIKRYDFMVLCGHRGKREQDDAFARGMSKLKWPDSKHNKTPSLAVDLAPFPIDWHDLTRFRALAAVMMDEAKALKINIRWGADWDQDGQTADERFLDWPHFELMD